jgi:hypothetical protein
MADAGTPIPSSAAPDAVLLAIGDEEKVREKDSPMQELVKMGEGYVRRAGLAAAATLARAAEAARGSRDKGRRRSIRPSDLWRKESGELRVKA